MQDRPDVVLRYTSAGDRFAGEVFHFLDGGFAGHRGAAHGEDFVRAFDRAAFLGELFAGEALKPCAFQRPQTVDHNFVDREALVARRVFVQEVDDFVCEFRCRLGDPVSDREVEHRSARALFPYQGVEFTEERRVLVVPHHHIAIGTDQCRAEGVVGVPELHIGAVGRIADVQRIKHQEAREVAILDEFGQSLEAKFAHAGQVGQS